MSAFRDSVKVSKRITDLTERQMRNVKEAVEVTQALVINEARALVPVKTGFLQASIGAGEIKISRGGIEAEVRADAEYADFVEFGTSLQDPQPYLGPALLQQIGPFRRRVEIAVKV